MYKYSLIFFSLAVFFGCATPQAVDNRKEIEESNNSRLDQFNVSQLVFEKDTKTLEELINSGKIDVKKDRTVFQNNIAHVLSNCNVANLRLALDKGAPLDELNTFQDTPLSIAVSYKNLDCASELLARGAKTTGKFSFDNPLMSIAAKTNNIPMIKLLMKYNVCPLDKGFIDTPILEISGLNQDTLDLLTSYIYDYTAKFGNKCPQEKPLPKK